MHDFEDFYTASKETGTGGWVFGLAVDGIERVQVVTAKGQRADAQLSGRYFAAWWPEESTGGVVRIVATTPDQIITSGGGKTTSRPR